MILHSVLAGAAISLVLGTVFSTPAGWAIIVFKIIGYTIMANLAVMLAELAITHPTADASQTVHQIVKGGYAISFWVGVILIGNILPLIGVFAIAPAPFVSVGIAILVLAGGYITEHIWVESPQKIHLS